MIKFLKTDTGKIVIGIIWGLGLACLFRQTCVGRKCIVYKAPNPTKVMSNVYSYNNKCYKYVTETTKCTDNVNGS